MDKVMDASIVPGVSHLLQQIYFDDLAFLGFLVLLSICYGSRGIVWDKPDPYHHVWFEKPQADGDSKEANTRDIGLKLEQSVSAGPCLFHLRY
jgi:NADPH-ferrihemoprotein reductase